MCLAIYSKHTSAVKHGCFLKRLVRFRGNLTMQFLKTRSIEFNRNLRVLNAPAIFEYITVLAYPSRFRGECRGPRCMSFQTSVLGNL